MLGKRSRGGELQRECHVVVSPINFSRLIRRLETQDIKTQPQINHSLAVDSTVNLLVTADRQGTHRSAVYDWLTGKDASSRNLINVGIAIRSGLTFLISSSILSLGAASLIQSLPGGSGSR